MSQGLTALQLKRNNYMQLKLIANDFRAKFARKERDRLEELQRIAEQQRIAKEEEEHKREAERLKAEKAHKTKEYFGLNKAFRLINLPGEPMYYGDNVVKYGAWFPHGFGEMSVNGKVKYAGGYEDGKREGKGILHFDDGSCWEGMFRNGNAHGPGIYTPPPIPVVVPGRAPKGHKDYDAALEEELIEAEATKARLQRALGNHRMSIVPTEGGEHDELEAKAPVTHIVLQPSSPIEALMHENRVICLRSDLIEGKQFEFNDPQLAVTSVHSDHVLPRAILIRHVKKWRYLFRFQDQVIPREREVNLEFVKYFRILHQLPVVTTLAHIGMQMDEDVKYDYYQDTYGPSARNNPPFLPIAIGRKDENMRARGYLPPLKAKDRQHVDPSSLNIFESGLSGIAIAEELALKAEQIVNRKRQWAKIVDKKRDEEEAERRRQIEESHAQLALEEQLEREEMERKAAAEVEEEMSKYSTTSASRHSLSMGTIISSP